MSIELHNIPEAATAGKHTNVIIEHGFGKCVFHRVKGTDLVQVSITPNILKELKVQNFMLTIGEFKKISEELDLEEIKEEDWVEGK